MHLNSLYCEIVVKNTDAEFIDETKVRRSKADRRNLLSGALSQELKNNKNNKIIILKKPPKYLRPIMVKSVLGIRDKRFCKRV